MLEKTCCDCGCGEKSPVLVPTMTKGLFQHGEVKSLDVEAAWMSPCQQKHSGKHYGMYLWDEYEDQEVDPPRNLYGNV